MGGTPGTTVAPTRRPACVLLACRNGEGQIATAVARAVAQAPVFVVSDGSTDATAATASAAGADVLELGQKGRKPAPIAPAPAHFPLESRLQTGAVTDDDTPLGRHLNP